MIALAVAVHVAALGHPFVFDDRHTVLDNPSIRDLANLRWILMGSRRPLTNLSYALDWAIFGPRAFGFHLTNLVLHAVNTLLLFLLGRRLLADDWAGFSAAAIFAVHPLLTETVGYVASRPGLLCTLFLLAGTWSFVVGLEKRAFWIVTALCWPLAAASKETGLLLPALCVAADVSFGPLPRRRRVLFLYLPAGLLALVAGGARLASYLHLEGGAHRPLGEQLLTQAHVFWRYVFLFVAPVGQSLVHEVRNAGLGDPIGWLSVAGLLAALALAWTLSAPARFGAAWFVLLLLPSSLVPMSQQMAEHRVYEAAAGAALLVAALLARRKVIIVALIALLAMLTIARERVWSSPVSLWRDAAAKAPRQWMAHYALADALRESGDCASAVGEYRAALTLRPDDLRARRNLSICLATVGQLEQAEAELLYELARVPHDPTLHYDLALVLLQRNQLEEARGHFLRALELRPGYRLACDELARRFPDEPPPISCSQPEQIH